MSKNESNFICSVCDEDLCVQDEQTLMVLKNYLSAQMNVMQGANSTLTDKHLLALLIKQRRMMKEVRMSGIFRIRAWRKLIEIR